MNNSTQEVQGLALQQAASQFGVPMPMSSGNHLSTGAKYVLKQAEVRGVIIRAYGDLSQQAIRILGDCLMEAATAFANGALSLQAINQQVHGTEVATVVAAFNAELRQDFARYTRTLFAVAAQGISSQFSPFDTTEQKRTWIQRLLAVD